MEDLRRSNRPRERRPHIDREWCACRVSRRDNVRVLREDEDLESASKADVAPRFDCRIECQSARGRDDRSTQSAGSTPVSVEMSDVCLSGGADGADLFWGDMASEMGHDVVHFSFAGHRTRAPTGTICVLDDHHLSLARPHLTAANRTLGRRVPTSGYVSNLLKRNFYQVESSESLYAISRVIDGSISGGTAWAVQMFLDMEKRPAYVFDPCLSRWLEFDDGWKAIEKPPKPSGIWTGIGSRKIPDLRSSPAFRWD